MNSKRILIVDDNTLVRKVLIDWIQFLYPHYEIVEANNGFEALTQLKNEQPFDLILTDYQMPVMDGLELARNIRQSWPDTRIVLMTGYFNLTQLESEICVLRLDSLLEKPISFDQLEELLSSNTEHEVERQKQC